MKNSAIDPSVPFPFDEEKARRVYQPACFLCATHMRPDRLNDLPGWSSFIRVYAPWKATHKDLRQNTDDRLVAHPERAGAETEEERRRRAHQSKRLWSACRRWASGSAADINALDRLYIQLGIPLGPDDFPRDALLRRRNYPLRLTETDYAVRVALVVAMEEAKAALEGRPPVWSEDEVDALLTPRNPSPRAGGNRSGGPVCCPACGGSWAGTEPGPGGGDLLGDRDPAGPVRPSGGDPSGWWHRDD